MTHIGIAYEDRKRVMNYCKKIRDKTGFETRVEGPWEFGGQLLNPADKTDWDTMRNLAKQGDFEAIPSHIYIRFRNALHSIREDYLNRV